MLHPRNRKLRETVPTRRSAAAVAAALAVTAATGAWPARASAQAPSTSCAQIESNVDRLACYDRAFPPASAAAPKPAAAAAPAAPARSLPEAEPADGASHVATEPRAEPRGARGSAAQPAPEPPAPAVPAATATARAAPAPAQAAQVDADVVPIIIVNVRDTPGRNAKVFTADNGTIWVQTDSAALNVPETPFNAQIKKGMVGSFFLVPTNKGRAVRVRRGEN
ncbi:MAG TPA: hypothetical protein VE907_06835 [Gammaproteobacteria bacterium]|nr:hypothetical protein [Gammaproteobacteria bacterium]